jgi:hypothetical protein
MNPPSMNISRRDIKPPVLAKIIVLKTPAIRRNRDDAI